MTKLSKLFYFLICLFGFTQVQARIEILNITPADNESTCNGRIELRASGTAGTFDVSIPETGTNFYSISGLLAIEGLCTGSYTLLVSPTAMPGCAKVLNAEISSAGNLTEPENPSALDQPDNTGISNLQAENRLETGFDFLLSPNPADDLIQLQFWRSNPEEDLILDINDAVGHKVLTRDIGVDTGSLELDLGSWAQGLYFVILRSADGNQRVKPLVLQ